MSDTITVNGTTITERRINTDDEGAVRCEIDGPDGVHIEVWRIYGWRARAWQISMNLGGRTYDTPTARALADALSYALSVADELQRTAPAPLHDLVD
jgi:hypothetical protein